MNCYDFGFSPSYSGRWKVFKGDSDDCWGTLNISPNGIKLNVMYKDNGYRSDKKIEIISGFAYSEDSSKKKGEQYSFFLINARLLSCTSYLNNLNHNEYDIEAFIVSKGTIDTDNINSVCLRTFLMDSWCGNIFLDSFDKRQYDWNSQRVQIDRKPQQSYELFKNGERKVYIYFGDNYIEKTTSVGIVFKSFLNVIFDSPLTFDEAHAEINKYIYMFYFLWNTPFEPDFLEFRSEKGNFIFKVSKTHSYQYEGLNKTKDIFSSILTLPDLNPEQVHNMVAEWLAIYQEFGDSIDTYCETISNAHHNPQSQIKSYISVIDGLTKNIVGETCECHTNSKRHRLYNSVITASGETLSPDLKQQLRNALIPEKGTALKPRMKKLIQHLYNLLPPEIDDTFVEKAVNTRNNLTHPRDREEFVFQYQEYDYLIFSLIKIIRAFILNRIGFPEKETKLYLEY